VAVEIGAYGSLESFQVLCVCHNAAAILQLIFEIANVFLLFQQFGLGLISPDNPGVKDCVPVQNTILLNVGNLTLAKEPANRVLELRHWQR
jgi:hypothetical protein